MLPRRSPTHQPSKFAGLYFGIQLFLGWFVITNVILNFLSTSSTLSCRRVRPEAAKPSYPPNCFIVSGLILGSEQIKELPNGQLLSAKLRKEGFFTLTSDAVILETTQGEIRFSPRNHPSAGLTRNFAQEINLFLQSSEEDSIEIWSGYESSFDVLFKIFGIITCVLGVGIYQAIIEIKRPPKQQEKSDFDKWAETSDRLRSLDTPTAKEMKLPPNHPSTADDDAANG